MNKRLPTIKLLDNARQKNVWDFGNSILYKLCKDNFKHNEDEIILTKVLFIGRIYAAAVERRKNKSSEINDNFYKDSIAKTFKESNLDEKLSELKNDTTECNEIIKPVLQTHYYLTNELKKITAQNKRSFCSKYLHFHLPELFYIYDQRSVSALRQYSSHIPKDLKYILEYDNIDIDYAKFYCKSFDLNRRIKSHLEIDLTHRQFDNLLIEVANNQNIAKLELN